MAYGTRTRTSKRSEDGAMSEEQLKELRKALRDAVMALVKLTFTIDDLLAERKEE